MKIIFIFLWILFPLIQTGWSANKNLFGSNHQTQSNKQPAQQKDLAPIIYEKEYFYFSAPDDKTNDKEALKNISSPVKKRYQIIFIKAPVDDSYEKALKTLIESKIEQKTHIYVFSKETSYGDLEQKFRQLQQNVRNKPEVYFIKYRNNLQAQLIESSIMEQQGAATDNKLVYARIPTSDNTPVSKNYAMNFLPKDVDVVPGSSYIPLLLK